MTTRALLAWVVLDSFGRPPRRLGRSVLGFSFLCHATANHRADRDEGEPPPFDLRQPGFEGGERRVVEMADGDRAAMPPARFARALWQSRRGSDRRRETRREQSAEHRRRPRAERPCWPR